MKRQSQLPDPRQVARLSEASEWLLRLQAPERGEEEYTQWLRWCDEDPENFAAFEDVQRRWHALDALKDEFALDMHPAARRRRVIGAWAAVAGVAAIVCITVFLYVARAPDVSVPQQLAASVTNREATLPDGSKMILGAQSLVNMNFNGATRQLDLSLGDAYFKVKHDKARPFTVQAGEVTVTALGTAFDVRRDRKKVTVTVEEGTVEVRGSSAGTLDAVWRVEAGHQLSYSTTAHTASLASVDPPTALAWRNGELAYLYEPLGAVVDDLNRYSARKIVIVDPEVAEIPFTGTAFSASLDGWLAAVSRAYPVEVSRSDTGEIILSSRK